MFRPRPIRPRRAHRSRQNPVAALTKALSPRGSAPKSLRVLLPNWWGVVGSQVASWVALGPSFLPRTWWMTAANVTLSQLYGYALGSTGRSARNSILKGLRKRGVDTSTDRLERAMPWVANTWRTLLLSGIMLGTAGSLVSSMHRQREIAELVDQDPPTPQVQLLGLTAGTGISVGLLLMVRLFRWQSWGTRRLLQRFLPAIALPFSGTVITALLTYFFNRSIVWERLRRRIDAAAEANNLRPLPGRQEPLQAERSGSDASYEPFNSVGRHGKAVVSDGPRAADIAEFYGEPAMEPVRAYVGLRPTVTIEEAAERAVHELRRAGGFERDHLCVYVGTGTGWLSDWSMAAMEFLTRGNCASVSLQYTLLPSAFAVILDRKSPQQTGRALYRAVRAELDTMPPEQRPKLYMSGESLGAFGGLAEFRHTADMVERLHGAVWAGTPQFSPIWEELIRDRTLGSSIIRPRIGDGSVIRFTNQADDLVAPNAGAPYAPWGKRRFIFMQHPSDPVVWWSLNLIWQQPEWMRDERGHDVTKHMAWWPWVTFWQIAADMPMSITTKGGHAHRYYDEYVTAWAQVLGVDADTDAIADAIRPLILPH